MHTKKRWLLCKCTGVISTLHPTSGKVGRVSLYLRTCWQDQKYFLKELFSNHPIWATPGPCPFSTGGPDCPIRAGVGWVYCAPPIINYVLQLVDLSHSPNMKWIIPAMALTITIRSLVCWCHKPECWKTNQKRQRTLDINQLLVKTYL